MHKNVRRAPALAVSVVIALMPGQAAGQDPTGSPGTEPIVMVVIGDSIPHAGFCPQCTGWVERYADDLSARTGRPVDVRNRSRNDSATLPMIREQVVGQPSLRTEVEGADVVIVSAGYNSLLPDPTVDVGCSDPDWGGTTDADWVTWSLTKTTPECIQAGLDAYAADYDIVFGELAELRDGQPTVMAAINVHNGNRANPWLAATGLPQADIDAMEAYMAEMYDRWNVMLCEHAEAAGFACVDVYHLFNGPTGEASSAPWTIDYAHPSDVGSEGIAGLLAQLDISAIDPTSVAQSPGASPGEPGGLLPADGWIAWQTDVLRVASLDGSESRMLLPAGVARSAHADWSPDGTRLAFIRDEPDGTADIRVVGRDGSGDELLIDCVAPCRFAEEPAWSPDGTRIAYWMGDDVKQVIRVADAATGETLLEIPSPDPLMGPITPRWSPDGRSLAVHAEVYEQRGDDYVLVDGRIGVVDLQEDQPLVELITPEGMRAMYPDWSPDGDRILFVAGNVDPFFGTDDPNDLYTVRPDGTDMVRLTERPRGEPRLGTPTWTRAGGAIVLTLIDGGAFTLGTVQADGSDIRQLLLDGSPIAGAHPRVWVEP